MKRLWRSIPEWVKVACVIVVALQIIFSMNIYWAILNSFGASTRYHYPEIGTGTKGPDGKHYVYMGEEFFVWIWIVRNETNGNCLFDIRRYAEVAEGDEVGKRYLISRGRLWIIGADDLRRTHWPQPSEPKIYLTYEVDENNVPFDGRERIDEVGNVTYPRIPLLPDGVDERYFAFYVVGRYFCNPNDYSFPRYIQGGSPNQTERVYAILKRTRP